MTALITTRRNAARQIADAVVPGAPDYERFRLSIDVEQELRGPTVTAIDSLTVNGLTYTPDETALDNEGFPLIRITRAELTP